MNTFEIFRFKEQYYLTELMNNANCISFILRKTKCFFAEVLLTWG